MRSASGIGFTAYPGEVRVSNKVIIINTENQVYVGEPAPESGALLTVVLAPSYDPTLLTITGLEKIETDGNKVRFRLPTTVTDPFFQGIYDGTPFYPPLFIGGDWGSADSAAMNLIDSAGSPKFEMRIQSHRPVTFALEEHGGPLIRGVAVDIIPRQGGSVTSFDLDPANPSKVIDIPPAAYLVKGKKNVAGRSAAEEGVLIRWEVGGSEEADLEILPP